MANNGAFIDKGALWAQLEWMRDAGTQYDRFCTSADIEWRENGRISAPFLFQRKERLL